MAHAMREPRDRRVLGIHTSVGSLRKTGKFASVKYLWDNNGLLPPAILCSGNRTIVEEGPKILGWKDTVFLDAETRKLDVYPGRVAIAIGVHEHKGLKLPMVLVESQMGMGGTQINIREILAYTTRVYNFGGMEPDSDAVYVIRVGTSAALRTRSEVDEGKAAGIGDLLIADRAVGQSLEVMQTLVGPDAVGKADMVKIKIEKMKALGFGYTGDRRFFDFSSDPEVTRALISSAKGLGVHAKVGASVSKASLYAEANDEDFEALRERYGALITEMEHLVILFEAGLFTSLESHPVRCGMVCAAIGEIPHGHSFPETPEEEKKADDAKGNMLRVGADALVKLVYKLM